MQYHVKQKSYAERAVIKAEKTKKQADINQAKTAVSKLSKSKGKPLSSPGSIKFRRQEM
ncbi:hypothetical protein QNN00_05105 [Bacillus velezensis]|nr:hypothetical protein [Bacillus velezensis]